MDEHTEARRPGAALMAAPTALARFLETADTRLLEGIFSSGDVTILENFPPHVFLGQAGLARWRELMTGHVSAISDLAHRFGAPQDFVETGDTVHFTLPTQWSGVRDDHAFTEQGGWTFVQTWEDDAWRIRSYGWAVIRFERT
ncbi:hypothetical protein [Caulobacter hibisci]|uniref:SnoaL-like domain-containing protein n=1 Tax=Caulobacter hibisci TaxID=2035993 RepID=A0ABS0SVQ2_9CAUL|nr:hypothetical protein [Caulobacter hibisci]MBI1683696.1 hypothetical protein [Caulobacter hibisci]